MPEIAFVPYPVTRIRRSVFVKLVTIMVTMAISLLIIVSIFFWMVGGPSLISNVTALVREYARAVAATRPDLDAAKQLASRMQVKGANVDLQIAYEGADG